MNKFEWTIRSGLFLGCLAVLAGCGRNQGEANVKVDGADAGKPGIVLVKATGVDAKVMVTLADYVRKEWRCPVRVEDGGLDAKSGRLDDVSSELQKVKKAGDVCAVAVCGLDGGELLDSVQATNGVGIVNVKALGVGSPDARTLELRKLKEPMRAVGLAAGLKPCPFPQCGLYKAHDAAELDYKGCNYCPPCQLNMDALLKSKGIEQVKVPPQMMPKAGER